MDTYQFSQAVTAGAVAFSPGSTFIATAQGDQVAIRLTANLEPVRTWTCSGSDGDATLRWAIDSLQWSTSGTRVLAFSTKLRSAWAFSLTGEDAIGRLSAVDSVEWGGEDVVSSSDRGVSFHDLQTGASRFIQNVQNLRTWSPDARYLATVERHQGKDFVGVYDREALIRHFAVPTTETAGVLWSPCGKWIAVWDWHLTYSLYVYSPVGAQLCHYEPDVDIPGGILKAAWSSNGRYLAIGDSEGVVRVLESGSWSAIATLQSCESQAWCETPPSSSLRAPKLSQFVRAGITAPKGPITHLAFNSGGSLLSVVLDNVLQIYTFETDAAAATVAVGSGNRIDFLSAILFNNAIRALQWCPNFDRLGVVTRTRALYVWDRLGVEGVDVPAGPEFLALDVQWSPDGKAAAICGKSSFCVLYDEETDAGNAWEEEP